MYEHSTNLADGHEAASNCRHAHAVEKRERALLAANAEQAIDRVLVAESTRSAIVRTTYISEHTQTSILRIESLGINNGVLKNCSKKIQKLGFLTNYQKFNAQMYPGL